MFRWRWLLFDFIPDDLAIDRKTRREIRGVIRRDRRFEVHEDQWRNFLLAGTLIAVCAGLLALTVLIPWARNPFITMIVIGLAIYVAGVTFYAPERARRAYRALRDRGFDVCTRCGYSLGELGADTVRCPECGADREPMPEAPP